MKPFRRRFDVAALASTLPHASFLRALLQQWQLPGPDAEKTQLGLRLAVRDGYLNFYAKGQSVAKLSVAKTGPSVDVHGAYVLGAGTSGYNRYRGDALRAVSRSDLDDWTGAALSHAGEEKRFVDELVTANPGTIDLEMGLPGDPRARHPITNKMTAPRMDLVVVQSTASGPQLAFWEAKCADNGELRANKEPHVVEQLRNYARWLRLPPLGTAGTDTTVDRAEEVVTGFRDAAFIMGELAKLARKNDCEALRLWAAASASGLTVVAQPGIVVANYCSDYEGRVNWRQRTATLQRNATTFVENGHLARLTETSLELPITVQQYGAPPTERLPVLASAALEAVGAGARHFP